MSTHSPTLASPHDTNVKLILEWLALAHHNPEQGDATLLQQHLLLLRESPIPAGTRLKVLDLIYQHTEQIVHHELPSLRSTSLPISRSLRQRIRPLLDALSTLTQDYFNSLADFFDPEISKRQAPHTALRRVMQCIAWQIHVAHLSASPPKPGIWQELHAAYSAARKLGIEQDEGPRQGQSIHAIYIGMLLGAIAQPASFNGEEIEFIQAYIQQLANPPGLSSSAGDMPDSTFWVDTEKDTPPNAMVRRPPPASRSILFFSCGQVARQTRALIEALPTSLPPSLPDFARTRAGTAILKRLEALWGSPQKRRFPRRRNSYRVRLWTGFENLWQLARTPANAAESSEWMVTDESPDGYALMHVSGPTRHLKVGDIIAMRTQDDQEAQRPTWQICLVRRALSENPEHIELGVQLLAARATAAEIAQPHDPPLPPTAALILPPTPPLRPNEALILPSGTLQDENAKIIVMIERSNLEIREMRASHLDEQTSTLEVFSVLPDEN